MTVAKRKKPSVSPTQRSLKYLRDNGYTVAIVEHWNPHARIRQDLFGFVDILALKGDETLAVQATAQAVSTRAKKIAESECVNAVREAGWTIHVHGWRKNSKGEWILRQVDLS